MDVYLYEETSLISSRTPRQEHRIARHTSVSEGGYKGGCAYPVPATEQHAALHPWR